MTDKKVDLELLLDGLESDEARINFILQMKRNGNIVDVPSKYIDLLVTAHKAKGEYEVAANVVKSCGQEERAEVLYITAIKHYEQNENYEYAASLAKTLGLEQRLDEIYEKAKNMLLEYPMTIDQFKARADTIIFIAKIKEDEEEQFKISTTYVGNGLRGFWLYDKTTATKIAKRIECHEGNRESFYNLIKDISNIYESWCEGNIHDYSTALDIARKIKADDLVEKINKKIEKIIERNLKGRAYYVWEVDVTYITLVEYSKLIGSKEWEEKIYEAGIKNYIISMLSREEDHRIDRKTAEEFIKKEGEKKARIIYNKCIAIHTEKESWKDAGEIAELFSFDKKALAFYEKMPDQYYSYELAKKSGADEKIRKRIAKKYLRQLEINMDYTEALKVAEESGMKEKEELYRTITTAIKK